MPELTQAEYQRLSGRLTRLENKVRKLDKHGLVMDEGDPRIPVLHAIIAEVKYAQEIFTHKGWPDAWSRWSRADVDARFLLDFHCVGVPW